MIRGYSMGNFQSEYIHFEANWFNTCTISNFGIIVKICTLQLLIDIISWNGDNWILWDIFSSVCPFCILFILLWLFESICQIINSVFYCQLNSICITEQFVATNDQHGLGKSQEEGEIWVWWGHKQEAECAATSPSTPSSKRVSPREVRRAHLQDKHGKEAEGETSRKQE